MSWNCPECKIENDDSMIRCFCGFEYETNENLDVADYNEIEILRPEQSIETAPAEKRKRRVKEFFVSLISLFISLSAVLRAYSKIDPISIGNVIYWAFALTGLLGSGISFARISMGRVFLIIFYAMQTVFIYSDSWRIKFSPGFAIPIGYAVDLVKRPVGISFNLFSIMMLVLVIRWLRNSPKDPPREVTNENLDRNIKANQRL